MILDNSEWFLLGAFTILFLYFITHYFTKRCEKYNLYFALGCFISIVRTFTDNMYPVMDGTESYYRTIVIVDHLSFIWGPFLYILMADSLFPRTINKILVRTLLIIIVLESMFIIFVPLSGFPYDVIYDYLIMACIIYATYIFTIAFRKKRQFALSLFIANTIFIIGVVYDVLRGSDVFVSPIGEIHGYTYFIYLYITSVVLARKYSMIDKKRLESQVSFLHAQIQPHFLYNTINTIIAYCRTDPEQSRELLTHLSTYLRGKFKSENNLFTSLEDEINLIKSYLIIEQVRFKEKLLVEYDIDKECNILIPCLILQPLVENAVKHGLMPKKEGGTLKISVKRMDENVVIKIKDNGTGMDINRLPDILKGSEEGIGISNTNERLKKYYNTEIKAKSEAGKGTEFIVTIPIGRGKKR